MDRKNENPHDTINQDNLTQEKNPPINTTDDVAHTTRLDPEGDPDEARKLIKGERDRSTT